ncbi:SusC/RagA family TonB-linked outer membrane protein [Pedobacter nyackensis]|uniref:TonB-linked outer membrane protein, SusC/RagA family n=1 Tax=Pedobacter nyackensis TaxID=475255 RepID=A0A1W2E4R3_9SPHI|nr:SusC/RagA family TonB-linked outer membrane protein [Pedobacter nyackensis]SMD04831.1 TonB-linked outer membrane protein, SusC/RagA family [Pedobacter nyackensis]
MKKKLLLVVVSCFLLFVQSYAQQKVITGKVTSSDDGLAIPSASVKIKGTPSAVQTNAFGLYSVKAKVGDVLVFSYIGLIPEERTVGGADMINVALKPDNQSLNEVVVTALGRTTTRRSLGTSEQTVKGADIAETQRENFVNALQGRVAGVEVTTSSGVPGSSASITIRGVSSISGSNQPLMIVDGLPIDNKTLNTSAFFSEISSNTSQANRTVDFTNRSSDINPEDIESLVVLKGPEAAALYGIDAANGAIVITTKRGKPGVSTIDYSNSFRIETPRGKPEVQKKYGVSALSTNSFYYFGNEYPTGTTFYDNIDGFFQTALTQKHNLSLSGGAERMSYRISSSFTNQNGVIPNSVYDRINLTGATQATLNSWLKTDLSISYTYSNNDQPRKGAGGPLIGLLVWPQTDNAKEYLNPLGARRRLTTLGAGSEIDNPYFNVNKNLSNSKVNRVLSNFGVTIMPAKWFNIKSNIGIDSYTSQNLVFRHPESAAGFAFKGIIDVANDMTRNISMQNLFNLNRIDIAKGLSFDATLGHSFQDLRSNTDASYGENFLEPDFISVNNTYIRNARNTQARRRLVSFFGRATLNYNDYLYVTGTFRNDRTSTIPIERYSFNYPSVSASFVFTDVPAFKGLKGGVLTSGKLRAAYAEVGKDAKPYAYVPALEYKATVGGGYGLGFTGPNPGLKPEFATSYEFGTELSFFNDRLGLDLTVYKKVTTDQIINDIRGSYATGYILFNLNGGSTRNKGVEISLTGSPIRKKNFEWNIQANFEKATGIVTGLPNSLPESYVSDTWLFGNVRNGNSVGKSTRSLTGLFYLRNDNGQLLIDATTGLPYRSTVFFDAGYDRQPDFSIGLTNRFSFNNFSLSFLLDIRKGGDILNATEQFLTSRGLSNRTLDRDVPRVIDGVLRDGLENTANPTRNNIVVVPRYQTTYYTEISEELFIEKDINWVRLRDVTLNYRIPSSILKKQNFIKNASVFVTGTDLFLITNYSGMDPVVNGNSAAVGGSGGVGIDYGNFPIPAGINFGVKIGL